jgi:L-idonate 5-dehydrogenase
VHALTIHGKQDLRIDELPTPEPGPGLVRLRVAYAGICGSDLHYYFHGANGAFVIREPLIPGHELSATVDLDPSGNWEPGTPVTVHPATFGPADPAVAGSPHLWPGGSYLGSASTWPHTQGGMTEYIVVRADQVRPLPDGLALTTAALAEPLAVALHAVRLVGDLTGASVLVSGSGPIGLLCAAAVRTHGAVHVTCTDVLPGPLARARALGADAALQVGVDEVPAEAFDVVVEATGIPAAINQALTSVRRAGRIAQVGMVAGGPQPVELSLAIAKEVRLVGCFRFLDEIDEAVNLLASLPELATVVTHVVSADQAAAAFEVARDSQESGKVLVDLWN